MKYTIVLGIKECTTEYIDNYKELATFENESEARKAFDSKKSECIQYAEDHHNDINLSLWESDEEDETYFDGSTLEDWSYSFNGKPTDGMVALIAKPSRYYPPRYMIINGDGKTQRYFEEIPQDIKVEVIRKEKLNRENMKEFGFPEYFINAPEISNEF